MATSRRHRNGGGTVTSRRRLILACITLAGCSLAMLAAILSLATTLSNRSAALVEMQQLVDEYSDWRHDMRQKTQTLGSELEHSVATAQERYDSLEEEKASNLELRARLEELEAQIIRLEDDCKEKLAAERQRTADQIALVAALRRDLAELQGQFDKLKIQLAKEQSANKLLAMELAAREAQEKEERFLAPAVMDVIYATIAENQRLTNEIEMAIKTDPLLANDEWGIPDNPDLDDPSVEKLIQMREDYYQAWCNWKAFANVNPGRTPEDYQAAHQKYTASLDEFHRNHLKKVNGHYIFNPPSDALDAQRTEQFAYLEVVDKYRKLSAEEKAKDLAAKLKDANDENEVLAAQLVKITRDLAKRDLELAAANKRVTLLNRQLTSEMAAKRKVQVELARTKSKLAAEQLARAKLVKQLAEITKERDDLLAGVKEKEKARQDAFEKEMSPLVVIDWNSAKKPPAQTLKEAIDAKGAFANTKWGYTTKPTAETRNFNVEQNTARAAYFKVKLRYEMFDKVSAERKEVLPTDYQDAYNEYQLSQLALIKNGLRTRQHVLKDGGRVDYYDPSPNLVNANEKKRLAYRGVVLKYRKLAGDL